ncbi:alpha/beta fold hydrolase [Xinfangfangia sp. D13-10-4-6]|uniref:alpha/beta hydrolase n=1 Tax=Pseudogemmobacter hezensis TaxID=2737662 RepID=UPI001555FADA|nr:alpha/beta fold hydrolase [Pseudogemmobacter hezensis]NPD13956.1 alpha/beta fold hydrolase [Pseudogemmobacter hezensis]
MRRLLRGFGILAALLVATWFLAPREAMDRTIRFDASALGDDPEIWLQVSEQQYTDIRPGAVKRILWAGERGRKTPLSIVYVHGFTASAEEIRPVPDEVARALGANLFYTRLSGQGRSGEAMADTPAGDWIQDMAEAMAIGRMLGDRVIVIGTSMGGALTALSATDPQLSRGMAGVVLISPAFSLQGVAALMMDAPFPRLWAPLLLGRTQTSPAVNQGHSKFWATSWPTAALYPLAALMREARAADYTAAKMPLLVFYAPADQIIDPTAIAPVIASWGGAVEVRERVMQAGDDPYAHVIAGDIFSPGQTEAVSDLIITWAKGL